MAGYYDCISEPFDYMSWLFILLMCMQAVAVTVYLFEWYSPSGLDRGAVAPTGKRVHGKGRYQLRTRCDIACAVRA